MSLGYHREHMVITCCGLREGCEICNVVAISGVVFLTPCMSIARNISSLQKGSTLRVRDTKTAIKHFAQCIHARGSQVVKVVTTPLAAAALVRCQCCRHECSICIGVTNVGVEVAEVVDAPLGATKIAFVADIDDAIAIEIGGIVVGFVIKFMVAPHDQHIEGWGSSAYE